jgi:hypothetical protein
MISVYLDMDGVIADFFTSFDNMRGQFPGITFRQMVMEKKIFRDLAWMPGAVELIERLRRAEANSVARVALLTSAHTYKVSQMVEAQEQKQEWLLDRGIRWDMIVTSAGEEKAMYAEPDALLIDDRKINVDFWMDEGGMGLLYDHETRAHTDLVLGKLAI